MARSDDDPQQVVEVGHFLAFVEPGARNDGIGHPSRAQGLLVDVHVAHGAEEHGHIAEAGGPGLAGFRITHTNGVRPGAHVRDPCGNEFRLGGPMLLDGRFLVRIGQ